jgi:hypothetical protein
VGDMLPELLLLFNQKFEQAILKQLKSLQDRHIRLSEPEFEPLCTDYVRAHYAQTVLKETCQAVLTEKQNDITRYFSLVDEYVRYLGAIEHERDLVQFFIKTHQDNKDLMTGMNLSEEYKAFFVLSEYLSKKAKELKMSGKHLGSSKEALKPMMQSLFSVPHYEEALNVMNNAPPSAGVMSIYWMLTEFSDIFSQFYNNQTSQLERQDLLDQLKTRVAQIENPMHQIVMKKTVNLFSDLYQHAVSRHFRILAQQVVNSDNVSEAKRHIQAKSGQPFYHYQNKHLFLHAINIDYRHTFRRFFGTSDQQERMGLLYDLAKNKKNYGRIDRESDGLFMFLYKLQKKKNENVVEDNPSQQLSPTL